MSVKVSLFISLKNKINTKTCTLRLHLYLENIPLKPYYKELFVTIEWNGIFLHSEKHQRKSKC